MWQRPHSDANAGQLVSGFLDVCVVVCDWFAFGASSVNVFFSDEELLLVRIVVSYCFEEVRVGMLQK